jgi:hypothetical protein
MIDEGVTDKLKKILLQINSSEYPLSQFYEMLENETGGKLKFSSFKIYFDNTYGSINKSN